MSERHAIALRMDTHYFSHFMAFLEETDIPYLSRLRGVCRSSAPEIIHALSQGVGAGYVEVNAYYEELQVLQEQKPIDKSFQKLIDDGIDMLESYAVFKESGL